jgi:hypothetical protein
VSTTREGDIPSEVGREDAGVETSVLSTVKAWPHDAEAESRFSVEEGPSTVKASAQEEVWAVERPMRERRVVLRRLDLRILVVGWGVRSRGRYALTWCGWFGVIDVQSMVSYPLKSVTFFLWKFESEKKILRFRGAHWMSVLSIQALRTLHPQLLKKPDHYHGDPLKLPH